MNDRDEVTDQGDVRKLGPWKDRPVNALEEARAERTRQERAIAQRKEARRVRVRESLASLRLVCVASDGKPAIGGGKIDVYEERVGAGGELLRAVVVAVHRTTGGVTFDKLVVARIRVGIDPATDRVRYYHDDQEVDEETAKDLLATVLLHWEDFSPDPTAEIPF